MVQPARHECRSTGEVRPVAQDSHRIPRGHSPDGAEKVPGILGGWYPRLGYCPRLYRVPGRPEQRPDQQYPRVVFSASGSGVDCDCSCCRLSVVQEETILAATGVGYRIEAFAVRLPLASAILTSASGVLDFSWNR